MLPGQHNAITDVPGVRVGHTTVVSGDNIRTGVTAVLPLSGNLFQQKVAAGVFVGNAFGKLAGSTQIEELGTLESPIVLTNTLSVGTAVESIVRWTIAQPGNENVRSVNAVVGETNDGGLNDIRGLHVTRDHVLRAITGARDGAVDEGAVGAGTGTIAFGWKGGIGTSSRRVSQQGQTYLVGVLVQSNYGGKLTIAGVPLWKELSPRAASGGPADADGSCMILVATDAPLGAKDLKRVAARAIYAMARTGTTFSNGSGDFAIAFSTVPPAAGPPGPTDSISAVFEATLDATEEAIYNSMLRATDVTGNSRTVRALPVEDVRKLLQKYGR
jgi:D-aminopeptidase